MPIKYVPLEEPLCQTLTSSAHGADQPDSTSQPAPTELNSSVSSVDPESPAPLKVKIRDYGGRPLKNREDQTLEHQKPWEKANLSRSTWFRRRKNGTLD